MSETVQEGLLLDDRYRLLRPLSAGGMGSVWVAEQVKLQREVAVKLLLQAPAAEDRARLRMEALALAAVRHPAVVQIYDFGETPTGAPYVVMELVQGESLAARLLRRGAYDARAAVELMLPLLDGLESAHRAGVIHRDIKPTNVLISVSQDGSERLQLLDFGIARLERSGTSRLTAAGNVMGTPENMAPEQVRAQATDARTDIWGAGVLLYQMIAGENPFYADDIFVTMRRVIDVTPSYPFQASGLDGRLWRALMGALRKAPADRPASVAVFRNELSTWLTAATVPTLAAPAPPAHMVVAVDGPTLTSRPTTQPDLTDAPRSPDAPPSIDALVREKLRGS